MGNLWMLASVSKLLCFSDATGWKLSPYLTPDLPFCLLFHLSLLTWRPAGQEEETADSKHFVRTLTHTSIT